MCFNLAKIFVSRLQMAANQNPPGFNKGLSKVFGGKEVHSILIYKRMCDVYEEDCFIKKKCLRM